MEIDNGVVRRDNNHAEKYTAQQFINAIPGSGGIVTLISDRIGCSWNTARKYIDTHPSVRAAYNAECDKVLDAAESVILGKIKEKDEQTAKWYLIMKGRGRGYIQGQRFEVQGDKENPLVVEHSFNPSSLSDGELETFVGLAEKLLGPE